jgi:hypothetical protein
VAVAAAELLDRAALVKLVARILMRNLRAQAAVGLTEDHLQ